MSENVAYKTQLEVSIQDALRLANKLNRQNNLRKSKNRKSNKKKVSRSNALDGIVDNLLQMKEGERKAQLVRPIIPIREWLSNEYYCGAEVFNLYPFWKEHLIRIYESPVLINEIILTRRFRYRKNNFCKRSYIKKNI